MSLDARSRYTKMVITNSFIKLLNTKPFYRIKLKDVCDLAEIHRSTFYKYYRDIYDWREQIEAMCVKNACDVLNECRGADTKHILKTLLQKIQENIDLISVLFSDNWGNPIIRQMLCICVDQIEIIRNCDKTNSLSENQKQDYHFLVYGCMGIILCWINDGLTQSIDEIVEYIVKKIEKFL